MGAARRGWHSGFGMQILRWASKLSTLLEKYRLAFTESKVIVGIIINLEAQINATVSVSADWMMDFPDLKPCLLIKQSRHRDVEISRLGDCIQKLGQVHRSLNALLKDALAKTKDEDSLKSISPLEILQMIQDSFYSISKELHVQKKLFHDYVMGIISIAEMAERWDDCTYMDFRIEEELKKRMKYFK